jgi:hypothetical protein
MPFIKYTEWAYFWEVINSRMFSLYNYFTYSVDSLLGYLTRFIIYIVWNIICIDWWIVMCVERRTVLYFKHCPYICIEQVGPSGDSSDLYLGGFRFKFQPGHRISWDISWFPLSFQSHAEIVFLIMPRPLPSTSLEIHYSLIILSFNAVKSAILTALLNQV